MPKNLPKFLLAVVLLAFTLLTPSALAGYCTASTSCPVTCSLSLTCPGGCTISCVNHPNPASVSCSGQSSCSVTSNSVFCDGNQYICPPFECTQTSNSVQCSNNETIYCPDPGDACP
jgi:hypothetical protein